jgi:DNA-binding MarR family transcriptional regulator
VYRDEDDLALLAELAGVLDAAVEAGGLSSGSYLVLRSLAARDDTATVPDLARSLGADPEEVAALCGRLLKGRLAEVSGSGVTATERGRERARLVEEDANERIVAHVLDRPHTATVYGLVASMRSGRFTVEDLLEFLAEGPSGAGDPAGAGG